MTRFIDPRHQATYETARTMHATLSVELSGRGMAYRKGWNGQPYPRTWTSYPVHRAGRDNRRAMGGNDLPSPYARSAVSQ